MTLIKPDKNKPVFTYFPDKARLVAQGLCPFCKKGIQEKDFIDNKSKKEYSISGLCQNCQKEIFGE